MVVMNVKKIVVGELLTNCYIVEKEETCLIIDPGAEPEKIIKHIDPDKRVVGIFITHGHDDHTGAINDVYNKYICPIYTANNLLEEEYEFDEFKFRVIRFPGHKEDSVAFYFELEKVMFVGDFVFKAKSTKHHLSNFFNWYAAFRRNCGQIVVSVTPISSGCYPPPNTVARLDRQTIN